MRELNFLEQGKVEWRDAADPKLEGDVEALVRPVAVATCDLDMWLVRGQIPYQGPLAVGHEGVAEVTEVGDGVSSVKPGDRVSVPFQISCGECPTCRRGHTGNCERVGRMATYGLPIGENYGGFLSDFGPRSRSPTRCWCRSPMRSSRTPSPASPTTSPTPGGASPRSSRPSRGHRS